MVFDSAPSGCGDEATGFSAVPDPILLKQGWSFRYLADPKQAAECTQLYETLGFEVMQRPVRPENFGPGCSGCAQEACRSYVLVYTRFSGPAGGL